MLPVRRSSLIKPTLGQTLAYGNPLLRGLVGGWLFNENAGLVANNIINANDALTISDESVSPFPFWAPGPSSGWGLQLSVAGNGTGPAAFNMSPSAMLKPTAVTIFWFGVLLGSGDAGNNPFLAGMSYTNTNTSPFISYGITRQNNTTSLFVFDACGGANNAHTLSSVITFGVPVSYAYSAAPGAQAAYMNGRLIGSYSASGNIAYGTSPIFTFNQQVGLGGDNANELIYCCYVWNRALTAGEHQSISDNPWQIVNARSPRVFGWHPGVSAQTLLPGGLASAFAAGTPDLEYTQDIAPSGLASKFAAGVPDLNHLDIISPGGKPSDFAVGVPTVSLGTITPAGKASDFAAGKPTLNLVQDISPTGLVSAFAAGKPSLTPAQIIDPTGLASRFAAGSPVVSGGPQRINPTGLASAFKAGVPTIPGQKGIIVLIGGVDVTRYISLIGVANPGLDAQTVAQPMQLTSQTLGRWTAIFDFFDPEGIAYPEIYQTFKIVENGVVLMSGGLISVAVDPFEGTIVGSVGAQAYHVTAQDWSARCDNRVVNATYPEGSDIAGIVLSIWANVLCNPNEGITANNVPEIGGPLGLTDTTEVFNFVTVTQAFNQLATDTGCVWWIDQNADLHFVQYNDAVACQFSLTATSNNWRALSATATLIDYRNVQYVVSNLTAVPGVAAQSGGGGSPGTPGYGGAVVTETYTLPQAAATARGFALGSILTNFPMSQITQLKVNGTVQPVYLGTLGLNFQQAWWYFPGSNILIAPDLTNDAPAFPSPPVTSPYPNSGDVVEISYIPITSSQSAVVIQSGSGPLQPATPGSAGTWGSGVFENVYQVQNLNLQSDMNALAQALLNRSDTVPIQIQFETDVPGAQVGQQISINIPFAFIEGSTQWTITYIQATVQPGPLGSGSQLRWVIQATSGQDLGNATMWFQRLLNRTENPLPVQQYGSLTFVLAPGGSLAAGVPANNPVPLVTAGPLTAVSVICGTPPTDQNLVIDVLDNGVSILSSAIVIPAGSFDQVTTATFSVAGLTVAIGDLLSVNVSYQVIGSAPTPAANVTVNVQWMTAGLPAGQIQPGVYQEYVS